MKIELAAELFEQFPDAVQFTLIARNLDNTGEPAELLNMLRKAEETIRADNSFEDLKVNPFIVSWREAFQKFGINPNQCPPSMANLIKRVRAGKDLPFINKLVCIFNIVSLTFVLPAGGDDIDKVQGGICLGPAQGDEIYTPLGAIGAIENPKPGEIILYDTGNKQVFCRAWCWKNGDPSKIENHSKNVAINIDVLPPTTLENGTAAVDMMHGLLEKYCGAQVDVLRFDKNKRVFEI